MRASKKMFTMLFMVVLSLSVLLAGCGNTGSPAPDKKAAATAGAAEASKAPSSAAPSPSAPASGAKEKWVHGILTAKGDAGFQQMGLEKGYFDKLGIDLKIQEFESDATMTKALIADQIDSMEASPSGALTAIAEGADMKFVGATLPELTFMLYTKNDIKTTKDLKGRVVGISGPGALPQVIVQAMLIKEGMGINDVTWTNAGGDAARFKALVAGKVDAVISSYDFIKTVEDDPNIHSIADVGKDLPNYMRFAFIVTAKTTKTRGETLTKVLQAEAQGLRYAAENRDETIALTSKKTGMDKADPALVDVYDIHVKNKMLAVDLKFKPESIQWMYELNKSIGKGAKELNVKDYIDLSFADKAIQNIGPYTWKNK